MTDVQRKLTRVALGLAAMGSIVVGLWPASPTEFEPEKALAIAVAICAWIGAEWFLCEPLVKRNGLNPHDEALAMSLIEIANERYLSFLRHHDFGSSWRVEEGEPTFKLRVFLNQTMAEFEDLELQRSLASLKQDLCKFSESLSHNTHDLIHNPNLYTAIPDEERGHKLSSATRVHIGQLNDLATELLKSITALFRVLRTKGFNLNEPLSGISQR